MKNIARKLTECNAERYVSAPVTIAVLGDSVSQGCFELFKTGEHGIDTVVEPSFAYANRLLSLLRGMFPRAQINLINAGISGDSAPGGLKRIDRDVFPFSPDLLIVCYGLNDATFGLEALPEYENALESIFKRAKEKGAEVIFMTPNMMNTTVKYDSDKDLAAFVERTHKVQSSGDMDAYMNAARNVAKKCGVTVCDCYNKWKTLSENGMDITDLLSNAGNHPTREMHKLFAYSLLDTILFGE